MKCILRNSWIAKLYPKVLWLLVKARLIGYFFIGELRNLFVLSMFGMEKTHLKHALLSCTMQNMPHASLFHSFWKYDAIEASLYSNINLNEYSERCLDWNNKVMWDIKYGLFMWEKSNLPKSHTEKAK